MRVPRTVAGLVLTGAAAFGAAGCAGGPSSEATTEDSSAAYAKPEPYRPLEPAPEPMPEPEKTPVPAPAPEPPIEEPMPEPTPDPAPEEPPK